MSNIKTPISILQEKLIKCANSLPVYTEIASTVEFQETKFTNQCTWNEYKVKGVGTTKKEAKQSAAQEMINLLSSKGIISIPCSTTENEKEDETPSQSSMNSSNSSASSQGTFVNYVGSLMEFCVANKLPEPCFNNVSSIGLPHNFTFTMNCSVGSLCKEGSGNIKKVAKQNAAKEVLQSLKVRDIVDELCVQYKNLKLIESTSNNDERTRMTDIYMKIRNVTAVSTKHLLVKDYHLALSDKCENILETQKRDLELGHVRQKCYTKDISVIKSIIKNIFDIPVKTVTIRPKNRKQCIVGVQLRTVPPILQIGISATFKQAEQAALHKLVEYIIIFMK
ncbi:protein Loquacious isoform X1 [Megalopta genalis]|uniref:protein Loquacious isoform X1 n=2 Tax=Megalopta genalis TaxID=115081 RepID=UPI003FCF2156